LPHVEDAIKNPSDYPMNRPQPQERSVKKGAKKIQKIDHFALATLPPFVISYAYNERMVLMNGMKNGCFSVVYQDFEGLIVFNRLSI